MTTVQIILLSVVVLLIVIGATQRKKLVLLIKSETNHILKEATNSVKVLELRLEDLKTSINKIAESAGSIYAQLKKREKDVEKLKKDVEEYLDEAKEAKKAGNIILAKTKLEAWAYAKKALEQAEQDIINLNKTKTSLESTVLRLKLKKEVYANNIEYLKGRDNVNGALKNIAGLSSATGESLDESINLFDDKVSFEEDKLSYMTNSTDKEDFSKDINDQFDKL